MCRTTCLVLHVMCTLSCFYVGWSWLAVCYACGCLEMNFLAMKGLWTLSPPLSRPYQHLLWCVQDGQCSHQAELPRQCALQQCSGPVHCHGGGGAGAGWTQTRSEEIGGGRGAGIYMRFFMYS